MNIVRPAVAADEQTVNMIARRIDSFTREEELCVKELWEDYIKNGMNSSYRFAIVKDQNREQIIGFACYGKHALTKSTYDLYWIAVDPLEQRSGAGSDLLNYVEQQVLGLNGSQLFIETSSTPAYRGARKFYRHHQYRQTALLHDFYAPGDHLVIFSKRIRPPHDQAESESQQAGNSLIQDLQIHWCQKKYP